MIFPYIYIYTISFYRRCDLFIYLLKVWSFISQKDIIFFATSKCTWFFFEIISFHIYVYMKKIWFFFFFFFLVKKTNWVKDHILGKKKYIWKRYDLFIYTISFYRRFFFFFFKLKIWTFFANDPKQCLPFLFRPFLSKHEYQRVQSKVADKQ